MYEYGNASGGSRRDSEIYEVETVDVYFELSEIVGSGNDKTVVSVYRVSVLEVDHLDVVPCVRYRLSGRKVRCDVFVADSGDRSLCFYGEIRA